MSRLVSLEIDFYRVRLGLPASKNKNDRFGKYLSTKLQITWSATILIEFVSMLRLHMEKL